MSAYDRSAISLTSLPAAKTFSPPYTTTARTSSRSVASAAASRSSAWTWKLIAFIFGRSRRMVPTPSATSRLTNSPMLGILPGASSAPALPSLEWPGARTLADPRRGCADLARHQPPPRVDLVRGVDQLRGLGARGHRCVPQPVRRGRHRDEAPADRAVARHLARRGARDRPGPAVRLPRGRAVGAGPGAPVQPAEGAARPLRPRHQR